MCKHDKSLNTGVQTSYLSSHENALQEQPRRRGSAPYRRSDWISRLWGCPKNGLFKTTRERRAPSSSLLTLLNCGTRRSYASRFRGYALQRAPVRWTLTSEPTIGGGLRLCQSRNGATNSNDCRGELSRWRHAAVSSLHTRATEGARTTHVASEDKELNSRGKTKPKSNSLLHFNNRQQV